MEPAELRKLLRYEPETGKLYWLPRPAGMFATQRAASTWNSRYANTEAFTASLPNSRDSETAYLQGNVLSKHHLAHRVIWAIVYGEWPKDQIDHINGDRADNRLKNLRQVSVVENGRNQKLRKSNNSGVMGVHWYGARNSWQVYIDINRKRVHVGYFTDFDAAVSARRAAEVKYGFHENHGRAAA